MVLARNTLVWSWPTRRAHENLAAFSSVARRICSVAILALGTSASVPRAVSGRRVTSCLCDLRRPSSRARQHTYYMPFVHVAWLPKACRTAAVRKEVADAIAKAMVSVKSADVPADKLVIRFSESVDGFPLPKGHATNPELAAPQVEGAEAYLKDR